MTKIKSGLVFLVSKEILKEDYTSDKVEDMFAEWSKIVLRINGAYESGVFNAVPNFACKKFCPVKDCEHNGKGNYR
jgi:hypothetical protein